jgi:putative transcriptional regulator
MKTKSKARTKTVAKAGRPSIAERTAIAIRQTGAHARGEAVPGVVVHRPIDVKAVRAKVDMTQNEFAVSFGFSLGSVRDWEQGRKLPERTALTIMRMIELAPDIVKRAAAAP